MRLIFAKQFEGDSLDFQNGNYKRTFERKAAPFEVTAEEGRMLLRTRSFVLAPEVPPAPPHGDQADQSQGDEQAKGSGKKRARAQDKGQSEEK